MSFGLLRTSWRSPMLLMLLAKQATDLLTPIGSCLCLWPTGSWFYSVPRQYLLCILMRAWPFTSCRRNMTTPPPCLTFVIEPG
ncbi:hypothetical protein NXS19_006669 [Fusarium pseudograminearum]|nr:hypothetical protein NXS19_006669 [Fusarium pseudograminearum]